MKAIKMVGLVALAALMAMAFVGANSAMAEETTLCSSDEATCSPENLISHMHEESVGKAKLITSVGTIECDSLFLGDTAEGTGEGAELTITGTFTYTNCELGGKSCTAKEENGLAEIEVVKTVAETTKVTGKYLVHVVCSSTIDCSYTGAGIVGTGKGPLESTQANGEVTISGAAATKEAGGFLCPKSAQLTVTTTPPAATYEGSLGFHYCVALINLQKGLWKKVESGLCREGLTTPSHPYELVSAGRSKSLMEVICIKLSTTRGKYTNNGCSTVSGNNTGLYEKGTIQ